MALVILAGEQGFDAGLTAAGDRGARVRIHFDQGDIMSTSPTTSTSTFDAEALRRGIEERDAATLLGLYAEDAELHVVDRADQPSQPRIVRGRTAIGEYFADVCGRDMTHTIERLVVGDDSAAFIQDCRYPSGARVRCIAVLDLKDGLITRQSGVQAWDE
jgi:ketosteroid isomerase-like protein